MFIRPIINTMFAAALILLSTFSCKKPEEPQCKRPYAGITLPGEGGHRLVLYYGAGKNDLVKWLEEDIHDMQTNYLPPARDVDNVVLMYTRLGKYKYDKDPAPSYLVRIYRDEKDKVRKDTLQVYGEEVNAADPKTLNMVLEYVKDRFPDRKYGMVLSSHGSGWLPANYSGEIELFRKGMQRSIAQDAINDKSYEIDMKDFAEAIPMRMDYIIFDACFMGGVEVAYELRYACDNLIFSQTEILGDGFDYNKLLNTLLMTHENYLEEVCYEYYKQYEDRTSWEKSATISLVETRYISKLARVCEKIIANHREGIRDINRHDVQKYFRGYSHDYFYDLKDILIKAGATSVEIAELNKALEQCVRYKAATKEFMMGFDGFDIKTHSGLSMYIPDSQRAGLNRYYKTLEWNMATNLVD